MTEGGYMSTKKIIIISASEAIRNFFTLEAVNLELYAESFENQAVGQAIMNRLIKAAGHNIIRL